MDNKLKAAYKVGKMRSSLWVNPMLAAVNLVFGLNSSGAMRYVNFGVCGFLLFSTFLNWTAIKGLLKAFDLDEDKLAAK